MYNLLNDLIYLSDECIENLKLIKKYEDLVADTAAYNRMSNENKRFEEDKFKQKDKLVRIQIKLFNGALKFLVSICLILQNFFIKNDFTTNLVGFLNYSLNIFASPKLGYEIRTKNVNEYNFKPHFILGSILTIYSAFYDKIEFIQCVIKDERSYKFDNFDRAKNLVANNSSIEISQKNFQNYIIFVDNLRKEEKRIKAEQINFDDAPEEFLDTLTALIMTDPVKLPKSHVILDRKTIETHLLSDQTDPFNREPLTKDMLIPCPELKAKIEEYINRKKNEKLNSKNTQTNKING
jgi:ubiquitin conjugation factor E4 B